MTAEQKERGRRIWEKRDSLESRSITINLLLHFWEEANRCYEKKVNHIVGIKWNLDQDGEWECAIIDTQRSQFDRLDICLEGEEDLQTLFRVVKMIQPQKILDIAQDFMEIGFVFECNPYEMSMGIGVNTQSD